ncbi:hypothetical protein BDD12DRAFT_755818 [Trichophaea hybrida]|nr:hypothetical protein BDD12DRAFT_755818 [Trichophaea hybrida]
MEEGDRERPPSTRQPGEHPYSGQQYNPIPYQADYPQDSQTRQQPFPSYGDYNIPGQTTNQTYAPMQSYPPRQNTAIEVLANQFSGPPQYYVPGDSSTPVGPSPTPHHHQQPPSQFSSPTYSSQYSPATTRLPHPYTSSIPDLNPPAVSEPAEDAEYAQQQHQAAALDDAYAQYQTALKRTFQNMREGRLGEAGTSLLAISNWLLSNAVELGLVRDEQELHAERTRLWNEFNTCWLSVLEKEKEMLRDFIATGQTPPAPREFLREEFLERMGRELVRLCDNMERHGLVDYQMGVWEEEIIDAIQECLDLLEGNAPGNLPEGSSASGPSISQSSR